MAGRRLTCIVYGFIYNICALIKNRISSILSVSGVFCLQKILAITCELIRLLRATNWLPVPLGKKAELLRLTSPADIRSILFSCCFYLSDHLPNTSSRPHTPATSATTSGSFPAGFSIAGLSTSSLTSSSSHPPLEFYLIPLRKALHRNIHKIGAKYPLFSR